MTEIRIAALVLRNAHGAVLSVRKRNTTTFLLPGGKVEPGEAPVVTACREVREELGLEFAPESLELLGRFTAPAANEPGCSVRCDVFLSSTLLEYLPEVHSEIAEAAWCKLEGESRKLAPLSRDIVFPVLQRDKTSHLSAEHRG